MNDNRGVMGDRIFALRNQRDLTQLELADIAGLPAPEISRIEHGRNPRVAGWKVALLAAALETTMDYLYGLTDNPAKAGHLSRQQADEVAESLRSLTPRQRRALLQFLAEMNGEDDGQS